MQKRSKPVFLQVTYMRALVVIRLGVVSAVWVRLKRLFPLKHMDLGWQVRNGAGQHAGVA